MSSFSSINSLENFTEINTCSICLEIYQEPIASPCLHSFCQECILSIIKNRSENCPKCKRLFNLEKRHDTPSEIPTTNFRNIRNSQIEHNLMRTSSPNPFLVKLKNDVEQTAKEGEIQYVISKDKCVENVTIQMIANYFEELGFNVIQEEDSCNINWVNCQNNTYAEQLAKKHFIKSFFKQNEFILGEKPSDFSLKFPFLNPNLSSKPIFPIPVTPLSMPNMLADENQEFKVDVELSTNYFLNYMETVQSDYLYRHIIEIKPEVPNYDKINVLKKVAEELKKEGFDAQFEDHGNGRKTMTIQWCRKIGSLNLQKEKKPNEHKKKRTKSFLKRINSPLQSILSRK